VERATGLEPATLSLGIDMTKDQPGLLVCRPDQAIAGERQELQGCEGPSRHRKSAHFTKRKWLTTAGKSAALIIDRDMLMLLGWDETVEVVVEVFDGELFVSRACP
jgi:hypothetical protein